MLSISATAEHFPLGMMTARPTLRLVPLLVLVACALPAAPDGPETALPAPGPALATPVLPTGPVPPAVDPRIHEIVGAASAARVEADIRRLAAFGTRHTMSDTLSATRGIGAARRWLRDEFQDISRACGGCLEVGYVEEVIPAGGHPRVPEETNIVNVVATQRGSARPERIVIIQGHYDSRATDVLDAVSDAPGANDNASGTVVVLETARLLSRYTFPATIVYAALAGEEQGLLGGEILAEHALRQGWDVLAVLNNDIVGNTRGITGLADNTTARVFAPGIPPDASQAELRRIMSTGGELDGPSRQLGRYIVATADRYVPTLSPILIYRLDRFGRGSDHTPFFLRGFPAIRISETHEDYTRQHQDVRVEDGIAYGDVPDAVDFDYTARITALNAAALAALAWAPPPPRNVRIQGAVQPHTTLRWDHGEGAEPGGSGLAGYRVYWRDPRSPSWDHSRWVGPATGFTLENVVIDNWFFGVAAVARDGNESLVVFPGMR
jgi:hypothetical protein